MRDDPTRHSGSRKSWFKVAAALLLVTGVAAPLGVNTPSAAAADSPGKGATITLQALNSGALTSLDGGAARMSAPQEDSQKVAETLPASVVTSGKDAAIVDQTSVVSGALIAASAKFVDVSWEARQGVKSYRISKDGKELAVVSGTSYRDVNVAPGQRPDYRIETVMTSDTPTSAGRTWGLTTSVPSASTAAALEPQAESRAAAVSAAALSASYIAFNAFIPDSRIQSPGSAVCDQDKTHTYNGNGRGWASGYSNNSKAAVSANIQFGRGITGTQKVVGPTYAYNSAGSQVASGQASSADTFVTMQGQTATSIDLRMQVAGQHPLCKKLPVQGSILGTMQITLTNSGNWTIRSGSYRRMPNYEIYLNRSTGGSSVPILRATMASPWCLPGAAACETVNMTGWYGSY